MRVLLLTDIPPCRNFTAGLVLERLVSFLNPEEIAICAIVNPELNPEIPSELKNISTLLLTKPRESSLRNLHGRFGDLVAFAYELLQGLRVRQQLLPRVVEFGRREKVDAVWVVVQGQTMVRLGRRVAEQLGIRLLTQVWDSFGWWLRANRIDRLTQKRLVSEFDSLMTNSHGCATASWAMSEQYSQRYGMMNLPVIAGLPGELCRVAAEKPHAREEFVIGMAGQFYAQAEWSCLIHALNQAGWVVAGRRIRVRVLGGGFQAYTQSPANFEYLGWQNQEDAIDLLSDSDLLYMPYWFSDEYKEESSTSFPSKLVTYFASGRPVFCHAPPYASPARYLKEHQAGYLCESLDPPAVLKLLEFAISDAETYKKYSSNGVSCFNRDFTLERMKTNFMQFLSVQSINRESN